MMADLNNNETTVTGTLQVEIQAIADGTDLSLGAYAGDDGLQSIGVNGETGNTVLTYVEDAKPAISDHGAGASETPLTVQVRVNADLIDKDGSEAIITIVLEKGDSDGAWVDTTSGGSVDIALYMSENGTSSYAITINGFAATATIVDGDLVLSFSDEADAAHLAQNISITNEIGIQLPIDDSTDFNVDVTYTSAEVNAEGDVAQDTEHDTITIEVDIEGVVGAARIDQEAFEGEAYGGLSNLGFTFDGSGPQTFKESDASNGQFDSDDPEVLGRDMFFFNEGENQGELIITGAVGHNPTGDTIFRDSFKVDLEEGETLTVNLNDNGTSQDLMVKMIGESGFSYDETTNTLTFTAPAAGTYEWTIYNPELGSSYTAEVSIAPGIPTYVFAEDGDPDVADQGADTGPLVIAANFNLHTEDGENQDTNTPDPSTDSDNSEAITNVELTLTGAPAGTEFVLYAGTEGEQVVVGDEVITIDGADYNVSVSGDVLTLDLVGSTGGAQNIALGDVVSVRLPQHSDEDFSMTVVVETTEYDDDGGASQTTTATDSMNIVIDAVADGPEFSVQGEGQDPAAGRASYDEQDEITIPVEVTFDDNDGSETHLVILSDIPSDWIPNFGGLSYTVSGLGDGGVPSTYDGPNTTYTLTIDVSGLGDSDGLVDLDLSFDPQDWTSSRWSNGEAHDGGDAQIGITATTQETNTPAPDVEETDGNNYAEATTSYTVHIEEDIPEVGNVSITHDETDGIDAGSDDVAPLDATIIAALNASTEAVHGSVIGQAESEVAYDFITDGPTSPTDAEDVGTEALIFTDYNGAVVPGITSGGDEDSSVITLVRDDTNPNIVWGLDDEGNAVFAVHLEQPSDSSGTATMTFVQYQQINHDVDGDNSQGEHDDSLSLALSYIAVDGEGDESDPATATITIEDDGPTIDTTNAQVVIDDDDVIDAEGNAGGVGDEAPAEVTGTLSHNYGADEEGATTLLLDTGAPEGFSYDVSNDGTLLTVSQGDVDVMTVELRDSSSGDYTVTLIAPISHPEGADENNVDFTFDYRVTDGDGDTVDGTFDVSVDDDTPVATDAVIDGGTVHEDVLTGGNGEVTVPEQTSSVTGSVQGLFSIGADTDGTYGLQGAFIAEEVVTLTGQGQEGSIQYVTFTLTEPTAVTIATDGPTIDPQIFLFEDDGSLDLNNILATDDDDGPAAGSWNNSIIETGDEIGVLPAGTYVVAVGDWLVTEGEAVSGINNNGTVLTGDVTITVTNQDPFSDLPQLTSGGEPVVYSVEGNVLTASADGVDIFTLELNPNTGAYEFNLLGQIDHLPNDPANDDSQYIELDFGSLLYATDADGDRVDATGELLIRIEDDVPVAVADSGDVDEGGILEVLVADGVLENDTFGADGPGNVIITGVASVGNTLAALGAPIDTVYGELTLHSDGSYDYVAKSGVIDTDVVDVFTYEITDFDGDTSTATLSINVTAVSEDDVLLFAPGIALDGGEGFDTLIIPPTINFTKYSIDDGPVVPPVDVHLDTNLINNIEVIDLTNGTGGDFGTLGGDGTLSVDDVIEMTDDNNVLRILGDDGSLDYVHVGDGVLGTSPTDWSLQSGKITENGVTYNQYTGTGIDGFTTATLLVDEDILVTVW